MKVSNRPSLFSCKAQITLSFTSADSRFGSTDSRSLAGSVDTAEKIERDSMGWDWAEVGEEGGRRGDGVGWDGMG